MAHQNLRMMLNGSCSCCIHNSTAIPGDPDQNSGIPLLLKQPAFKLYVVTSLVALCSSVTALILFLLILTSLFEEKDFVVDLPRKLQIYSICVSLILCTGQLQSILSLVTSSLV
jgi:hypothetical protein